MTERPTEGPTEGLTERMSWDQEADRGLLSAFCAIYKPGTEDYKRLVDAMHSYGYGCTPKAVTQHLQKLRRKEGAGLAKNADGPSTPGGSVKKAKAVKTPKTDTKTGGKRKRAPKSSVLVDEEDDEDIQDQTPTKRNAKSITTGKPTVKKESKPSYDSELEDVPKAKRIKKEKDIKTEDDEDVQAQTAPAADNNDRAI